MPKSENSPEPTRCPLCGQANQCAMEVERATGVEQPACWCTQVSFTRELLEQLPAESLGQSCICPLCAQKVPLRA
jgi:hypothetical protein